MGLMDAVSRRLPQLRAQAASRMTSTVRVESVTVAPDPLTGADVVTVAAVVHAALACWIKAGASSAQPADVQGASVAEVADELRFPWDTQGLAAGQRATVTASQTPLLVGVTYRLAKPHMGDQQTAQRWAVESWPTT